MHQQLPGWNLEFTNSYGLGVHALSIQSFMKSKKNFSMRITQFVLHNLIESIGATANYRQERRITLFAATLHPLLLPTRTIQ
jgi:hypothetical protein